MASSAFVKFIVELTADATEFEQKLGKVEQRAAAFGAKLAVAGAAASAGFAIAAKEAINFESAFTGIEKTVTATPKQFAAIQKEIKELSTVIPVAADELARIGEIGGQLGVAAPNITSFTSLIADLEVSTDLTGEAAAKMVARFGNVAGVPQENFREIGDIIVRLGNNFATSESEILSMGQRLAGAGRVAGLTADQTLALAASLSSVGIEADAGGTAFSKLLIAISSAASEGGEMLDSFARISNRSAEQFANDWKTNPAEALRNFIGGLGSAQAAGVDLFPILEKLEITETRMRNAVLSSALAHEQFGDALDKAAGAADNGNDLAIEAERRYATLESQLQILKNTITLVAIEVGQTLLPALKGFVAIVQPAVKSVADFAAEHPVLARNIGLSTGAMGLFLGAAGSVLYLLPGLRDGFLLVRDGANALTVALGTQGLVGTISALGVKAAALVPILEAVALAASTILLVKALLDAGEASDAVHHSQQQLLESMLNLEQFLRSKGIPVTKEAAESWDEYRERLVEIARNLPEYKAKLDANIKAHGEFKSTVEETEDPLAAIIQRLTDMSEGLGGAGDSTKKLTKDTEDMRAHVDTWLASIEKLESQYRELDDGARAAVSGVERFAGALPSPVQVDGLTEALRKDTAAMQEAGAEGVKLAPIIAKLPDEFQRAASEQEILATTMRTASEEAAKHADDIMTAAGAYEDLSQKVPRSVEEMEGFKEALRQVSTIVNDLGKSIASAFTGFDRRDFNAGLTDKIADAQGDLDEALKDLDEYKRESQERFDDLGSAYAKTVGQMERDYSESLSDQQRALDDFVRKAEEAFDRTQGALLDKQAERLQQLMDQLDDRREKLVQQEEDAAKRISDLRRDEGERVGDTRSKYQLDLQGRQRDLAQYRAKVLREISEIDRGDEESAANQERNLRQSLAEKEQDLEDWMQDQEARMALETSIAQRELSQREQDVEGSLEKQRSEYEQYVADINAQMDEVRADTQERLAQERADLEQSITERVAEYERFKTEAAQKLEENRQAALEKYQQETADLKTELDKRIADYETFKVETTNKIQALQEEWRTLGGDILRLFTEDLPNALARFVSEFLVGQLFSALGSLTKDILPGIAGWFGKIFGGGGGGSTTDLGGFFGGIFGGGGGGGAGAGGGAAALGSNPYLLAALAGGSFLGNLLGGPDMDTVNEHTLQIKNEIVNLRNDEFTRSNDEWIRHGHRVRVLEDIRYRNDVQIDKWDQAVPTLWSIEAELQGWKPMITNIDTSTAALATAAQNGPAGTITLAWESTGDAILDAISASLSTRANLGR